MQPRDGVRIETKNPAKRPVPTRRLVETRCLFQDLWMAVGMGEDDKNEESESEEG